MTITQLRALADSVEGARPVALHAESIGMRREMRNMLVAASGLRSVTCWTRVYTLDVPGTGPVVIGSGALGGLRAEDFDQRRPAAQARVAHALAHASRVLPLGGAEPSLGHTTAPHAVAAGLVVIPMPGIAPGARMVYARLAGAREYLFTGDIARTDLNWREMRLPARLAAPHQSRAQRAENLAWLTTINALHRAAPQMVILAGSDIRETPFSARTLSDQPGGTSDWP
ncbi:hypothetical protein [Novosphingobium soli]|uniref:Amidohydrolase-related domain-containing protein n=1 Tax=Novosphingobium soli TaxID=574956 RepID=A0ABV6CVV5_9SPHN